MVQYEVDIFENSEDFYCPLTYTIQYDQDRVWLTQIDDRIMQWETDENGDYGDYTVTVVGKCEQDFEYSISYQLTIIRDCSMQVLEPPVVEN